jgi:Domain of unknown function (DUF3482)
MQAAQAALAQAGRDEAAQAMDRLAAAWQAEREAVFAAAMQTLAQSLARLACTREALRAASGWSERLRRLGSALGAAVGAPPEDADPEAAAQARLAAAGDAEARLSLQELLRLHQLQGSAEGEILNRVAGQFALRQRVPEGRAAVLGGALTGALAGLKADIVSGGLTLGGGLLAGGILGALGAAGVARGINVVRGNDLSWVAWSDEALQAATQAALLRYLAVAHFGRGRGDWSPGEAPPHWPPLVVEALAAQRDTLQALWSARSRRLDTADDPAVLAAALQPVLDRATRSVLHQLYGEPAAA